MNRLVALMQVMLLAVVASGCIARVNPEQDTPAGEIKALGGRVVVDKTSPDKPVVFVDLESTKVTDAGLEHLEGFTKLQGSTLRIPA